MTPPRLLAALLAVVLLLGLLGGSSATHVPGPATARAATERAAPYAGPTSRRDLVTGWGYRADPRDVGVRRHWYANASDAGFRPVSLPYSPNALPVRGKAGERAFHGSVGWFRRELRVSRAGRYTIAFESAHHNATVWVDGHRLGSHTGAYDPFSFTTRLSAGATHVLLVRLDWRSPTRQERQGWHRGWFNFGSLRGVSLRSVLPVNLDRPTVHTQIGRDEDGTRIAAVQVSIVARNHTTGPQTIHPQATLTRAGQRIEVPMPTVTVPAHGAERVFGRTIVSDPALWSPGSPNLYDLEFVVPGITGYRLHAGLRQLAWRDGKLFLNGHPLVLKGASLQEDAYGHGDALTPADQDRLIAELRAIGANATRVQHPLDQGLLERLDAAGILVWQQVGPWDSPGNWTSKSRRLQRQARARVRRTLEQDQAHPSIIAWVLANEVSGDNGHPGGQSSYIRDMARMLHRDDDGRLVAVDVWGKHIPRHPGPLYGAVDAIGVTSYLGWYESPYARGAHLHDLIRARLARLHRLFPEKVLVVSEFGAEANGRNRSSAHGGYGYQARLLAGHIATYAQVPYLSGMIIWALRDFALTPDFAGGSISGLVKGIKLTRGINEKGLFDIHGHPKPSVAAVRRAFAAAG